MRKTYIALYQSLEDARDAINALRDFGIRHENISLIANDIQGEYSRYLDENDVMRLNVDEIAGERQIDDESASRTASLGALIGGLTGLLAGLNALLIPGVGPVIAAGPVLAALAGAGIGALTGGIIGGLVNEGIPKPFAEAYAEALKRGNSLVLVHAVPEQEKDVIAILQRYHPVDMEKRRLMWQEEGWAGYAADAGPYSPEEIEKERSRSQGAGQVEESSSSMVGIYSTDEDER
jgi:uncharacterized membrane protein